MGAPPGNQFWKLRSKHGRDRLFADAKLLLESAEEYFEWCEANPLIEIDFKGKDADRVELPRMRAFTIQGLCLYLGCNVRYFDDFERKVIGDSDKPEDKDFSSVITRIREVIYTQKYTGAAAGFLNPLLVSKDLGLVDRKDITTDGQQFTAPIINVHPKAD